MIPMISPYFSPPPSPPATAPLEITRLATQLGKLRTCGAAAQLWKPAQLYIMCIPIDICMMSHSHIVTYLIISYISIYRIIININANVLCINMYIYMYMYCIYTYYIQILYIYSIYR